MAEEIVVPRNFKLLEELEAYEKAPSVNGISLGLVNYEDVFLKDWNGTIIGPDGTAFADRVYSLAIHAGMDYPYVAPQVRFLAPCVNLPCVDQQTGEILESLPSLQNWDRSKGIESIMRDLKRAMTQPDNRRLRQPPEQSVYP